MFKSDIETLANSAQSRLHLLKTNLPGYLVASMLAGFFVGIGVISFNVVGGYFQGNPAVKLLQGTVGCAQPGDSGGGRALHWQ
jgi:nitrite transporter NirC